MEIAQLKVKNQKILIDTNILIYWGDAPFRDETKKLLRTLADNHNSLAISHISCFELLRKILDKTKRQNYFKLVNYLHRLDITPSLLAEACNLSYAYEAKHKGKDNEDKKIDLMIGAHIIENPGAMLLTANRDDFPHPFWKVEETTAIMGLDGHKYRLINIYLLSLDTQILSQTHKQSGTIKAKE